MCKKWEREREGFKIDQRIFKEIFCWEIFRIIFSRKKDSF